jgi:hypothetical protein
MLRHITSKRFMYPCDLGYFSLEDLDQMDQRGAYYISRLKLNHTVYVKNPFRNTFETEP